GIRGFHVTGVQTCALPIFGDDGARPVPEALVGLVAQHADRHLSVLLVEGREGEVDPVRHGRGDAPRIGPVGRRVVPDELFGDLVQTAVDAKSVLVGAGAVGPLAAELETDEVTVGATRPRAPVPHDLVWPPASAEVEAAERVVVGAEPVGLVAHGDGAGGGTGVVLGGVLELLVGPGNQIGRASCRDGG